MHYYIDLILAKYFGILMLMFSLFWTFFHPLAKEYMMQLTGNLFNLSKSGFLCVFGGLWLAIQHNQWHGDWWVSLITMVIYLILAKGIMRLFFPHLSARMIEGVMRNKPLMVSMIALNTAIGAVFIYYGFQL